MLLEQAGFIIVAEAGSADEGYGKYDRHKPRAVVLDITLGDSSGLDVVRRIRARDNHVRLVIFTMHDDPILAGRAMRSGASGFVTKTSSPRELVTALQRTATGEHYLSQDIAQAMALCTLESPNNYLSALSPREFEIFRLLADGKTCSEIAAVLSLSPKSISNYSLRIKQKLGANSVADLVKIAINEGVLETVTVSH